MISSPFQCSSASRKFLNRPDDADRPRGVAFQCSSASRKFLNRRAGTGVSVPARVSVLFSEPKIPQFNVRGSRKRARRVSVLFSEPKIPQFGRFLRVRGRSGRGVSVLFSEPKIPQSVGCRHHAVINVNSFSALQRAENSSIPTLAPASIHISDRDDHASSFLSLPGASP